MKARIVDFTVLSNGKQRLNLELSSDFTQDYESLKDRDVDVSIKKWVVKKTEPENRYMWVLCEKIARKLIHQGVTKNQVYRDAIRDIPDVSKMICVKTEDVWRIKRDWESNGIGWQVEEMPSKIEGCTVLVLFEGSSVYDREQMSSLIDKLTYQAEDLGICTDSPEKEAYWNWLKEKVE